MARAKPHAGTTLRLTRVIDAPRERLFRAWTDPEQLSRWFTPIRGYSHAELDLRVGGGFRIAMVQPLLGRLPPIKKPLYCVGTYLEIDPPERLVYTLGWEGPPWDLGESLVTVEFRDAGGATEIVLVHERNRNQAVRAWHRLGWTDCIRKLAKLVKTKESAVRV
jgi:uncharacterized protein YndB with AHSA1/START domain